MDHKIPSLETLAGLSFRFFLRKASEQCLRNWDTLGAKELKKIIDNIQEYLCENIPKSLHNQLSMAFFDTARVIPTRMLNLESKKQVTEIFFDAAMKFHITKLNIKTIDPRFYNQIYHRLHKLNYLENFYLDSLIISTHRDMEPSLARTLISESFKQMPNLTSVTYKYFCNDATIKILAEYCKKLRHLNVNDSVQVTNESVADLIQMKRLKHLEIDKTSIHMAEIANLLITIPELMTLKQFYNIAEIVEMIDKKDSVVLNVVNVQCRATTKQLALIQKMFPKLECLEVECNDTDFVVVNKMPGLQDVGIAQADYIRNHVDQFIATCGQNVRILYLRNITSLSYNAMIDIGKMCPYLEKLILENCSFVNDPCILPIVPESIYKNVIYLEIIENVPSKVLRLLLSKCLNIATLIIINAEEELCDKTIKSVLAVNPMKFLKEIYLNTVNFLSLSCLEYWFSTCESLIGVYGLNKYRVLSDDDLENLEKNFSDIILDGMHFNPEHREGYRESGIFPIEN